MTTVKQGVFAGAAVFGFLKAANQNRKTNRALRRKAKGKPLTEEQERLVAENTVTTSMRAEPVIPLRTSTKVAGGAGVIAAFPAVELLQWVQSIQFETSWLEQATNSDYFVYYGALLLAWGIARISKSPAVPGKL